LDVLRAKEDGEIAQYISRIAKEVLPPKSWKIVAMWANGATYEEIAKEAGYKNRQGAWIAISRALAFLRAWVGKTAREIEANARRNSQRQGKRTGGDV
jgi:DNA-binding CsgD family transcriptional regulator